MSKGNYVYPGTFSPPTYGHTHLVKKVAAVMDNITIICSRNADKESWFLPEECKNLWRGYSLPDNIRVLTLKEFVAEKPNFQQIVMVRGIRSQPDLVYENKVFIDNNRDFGIEHCHYAKCSPEFEHISSSLARKSAEDLDLETLSTLVSPMVVTALLERTLAARNLIMVVGRLASGKSTILKELAALDNKNVYINTDDFGHKLRGLLAQRFGEADFTKLALTNEEEMVKLIAKPWMELLKEALRSCPRDSNILVESPFGLQPTKSLYKFIGGKVLYIGCKDPTTNEQRIISRGTPHLKILLHKIPDLAESVAIAAEQKLDIVAIETDGSLEETMSKAMTLNTKLNAKLNGGEKLWKTYSRE